ncbi:hypothetical protein [Vagococcus hydrophili]|uniref:WxL domain-containing protein n=1 Tax=Vagococcus hydrophili TaxID=2714947 RepID=A0A6G8ATA2_9ENTE|nr:hypothetical protein [Vagococcus hydrophili]QIL48294.1 hypothetical protein G7082_07220 [Vagococcus hydrophili]
MKKYLFSTVLLAGVVVSLAPSVTEAASTVERKQTTDVEIKFKDKDNGFDDKAENNLIMGATPTEISFTDGRGDQKGKGFTAPQAGSNAIFKADMFDESRYIVVNDDRPDERQSTWKVDANLSKFMDTKSNQESNLVADLILDTKGLQEYHIGAYSEALGDYEILNPNYLEGAALSNVVKPYTPNPDSPVITSASGPVTLVAGGSSVNMINKKVKGLDPDHTKTDGFGVKKGGQGYVTEFTSPKLVVKSGATKGSTHIANLTWTMTFDDVVRP